MNRALRGGFSFRNRRLSRRQLNLDAVIGRCREEASMSWGVTAPDAATYLLPPGLLREKIGPAPRAPKMRIFPDAAPLLLK
jgi:hypothetical protein